MIAFKFYAGAGRMQRPMERIEFAKWHRAQPWRRAMSSRWTDEDVSTLVRMWPTNSVTRIANRLHRSPDATRERARRLLKQGLLEGTITSHNKINGGRSTTKVIVFPRLVKEKPCAPRMPTITASISGSVIWPSAAHGQACRRPVLRRLLVPGTPSTAICSGLPVHLGRAHPRSYGHQITREDLRRPCSPPSSLAAFWYGASTVSPVDTSPRTSLVGRFREG